jgi:Holliday junction resolvase RusA-like endonuclease
MATIAFKVPSVPVAQPRQRTRVMNLGGKFAAQNYTPTDSPVNAFKASVAKAAAEAYAGTPLAGPLRLAVTFVFPRPKALTRKRSENPRVWAPKKPDVDNLIKSFCDALNGRLWVDDAQIVSVAARKKFASADEQPCVEAEILELETP